MIPTTEKPPIRFRALPEANAPLVLGQPSSEDFGSSIRMINWNIFKARRRGWLLDLETLLANAELVLLQEAVVHHGLAHPFHLTSGMEWTMAETLSNADGRITTGPKTGSRVSSLVSSMIRSHGTEPIIRTPKAALQTLYPFAEETLLVVNVHALNFVTLSKFSHQVEQILEPTIEHDGPCIVAGDFNTWSAARRHTLMGAMREARLVRVGAEFPRLRHFNQVLDHIFFRGLRLVNAHPLPYVKSSDHVPLWAEFRAD